MKTTVELPASLLKAAKQLAREQNSTLHDLIERSPRWVVTEWPTEPGTSGAQRSLDDVGRGHWRNMHPDKYVARLRRNWK